MNISNRYESQQPLNRMERQAFKVIDEQPEIFDSFCALAVRLFRNGHDHYRARTILGYLRMETDLAVIGDKFKLNDHLSPYFARMALEILPELPRDFFHLKGLKVDSTYIDNGL